MANAVPDRTRCAKCKRQIEGNLGLYCKACSADYERETKVLNWFRKLSEEQQKKFIESL